MDECDEDEGDDDMDGPCSSGVCHNTIGSFVCLQAGAHVNCSQGYQFHHPDNTCQGKWPYVILHKASQVDLDSNLKQLYKYSYNRT